MIAQHFIQTTNKFDFNFNNPLQFIDYVISFLLSILWNLLIKSIALFMACNARQKKNIFKEKCFVNRKRKRERKEKKKK